jgi:redox-sensitive bicupin YhaK (pirin superfamily)
MTREDTEPLYLDIDLPADSLFSTTLPKTHNAFVFVYRGEVSIGGKLLGEPIVQHVPFVMNTKEEIY